MYTLNWATAGCFLLGAFSSLLAGFLGMKAATMANVRTAQAASEKQPGQALMVAFNGGAVMGLTVAALGLIGVGSLFLYFLPQGVTDLVKAHEPIIGFAMGASSVALFARVGGIYTKAADVGSDLVGKVEAGIRKMTHATRALSQTTLATTWATSPAWARTSLSLTSPASSAALRSPQRWPQATSPSS